LRASREKRLTASALASISAMMRGAISVLREDVKNAIFAAYPNVGSALMSAGPDLLPPPKRGSRVQRLLLSPYPYSKTLYVNWAHVMAKNSGFGTMTALGDM
jgi:hypothetical protein